MSKRKALTVRLPLDLVVRLENDANNQKRTKSAMVNVIIDKHYENKKKEEVRKER